MEGTKPKLAFILHYYPFTGGYANRVVAQAKLLSKHFDIHLFYIFKKEMPEDQVDISRYVAKEHRLGQAGGRGGAGGEMGAARMALMRVPMMLGLARKVFTIGCPMPYASRISAKARGEVEAIMDKEGISLVWAFGIMGGMLAKGLKARYKVLDLCDSRYVLYSTLLKVERTWYKRLFYMVDRQFVRDYEKKSAGGFDVVAFISRRDGEEAGPDGFMVLPNMVELADSRPEKSVDLVMVGRWEYMPNFDGLKFAVNEVMPLLGETAKLAVVGPIPDGMREALTPLPNVEIMGRVEDPMAHVGKSRIMLVPIRAGAGMPTKTLDGLNAGIPVLTTRFVKESVDPDNECEGLLVCEGAEGFAAKIRELLGDRKLAERLGRGNMGFFMKLRAEAVEKHEAIAERMLAAARDREPRPG